MWIGGQRISDADHARTRLMLDQQTRPLVDQRVRLTLLSSRFERVGRDALIRMLSSRVRQDPRFAPVLQKLIRMTSQ